MKNSAPHPARRHRSPLVVGTALALAGLSHLASHSAPAANPATQGIIARTSYHKDANTGKNHSRTDSVMDPQLRTLTEQTFDSNDVLTVRKEFILNEKGEPMQGNIYDGRGNLVARSRSFYDELGRRTQDHLINLNGEVFQQVLHTYDSNGKALPPKVVNLNVKAPSIRPAAIDFTNGGRVPDASTMPPMPGQPLAPAGTTLPDPARFAPLPASAVQQPAMSAADATGAAPSGFGVAPVTPPPAEEKPKTNFFKNLFKKKEK